MQTRGTRCELQARKGSKDQEQAVVSQTLKPTPAPTPDPTPKTSPKSDPDPNPDPDPNSSPNPSQEMYGWKISVSVRRNSNRWTP